jgi:subtilisin-like proprotein convertase family protein
MRTQPEPLPRFHPWRKARGFVPILLVATCLLLLILLSSPVAPARAHDEQLLLQWVALEPSYTYSVAWGDVDGDGDLDLAVGNSGYPDQLYRNDGGTLTLDTAWNPVSRSTNSVVWGDVDGDGDLDLAVGNNGQPNQLYRNDGGTLMLETAWNPTTATTTSMAWGDVDGDADLDLLVGNGGYLGQPNQLYRNTGGTLTLDTAWNPITATTSSVAWGDVDGDGDLDLAVGNNGQPNQLYRNNGGTLTLDTAWNPITKTTNSVAWGDVDGDGDLDLAIGNYSGPNQLYRNMDGKLTLDAGWVPANASTESVAWGDVDGDGDLDLVAGNYFGSSQLYRNVSGTLMLDMDWVPAGTYTQSVAWGDADGDGDLDLALGNSCASTVCHPNQLYSNVGGTLTTLDAGWTPATTKTDNVAWGDVDGDGDLDLAVGNDGQPNQLYRNNGASLTLDTAWNPITTTTQSVAWGDVDGDGDLDLAVGNGDAPNQLYRNDSGTLALDTVWNPITSTTTTMAWGDVDGDGDLDLAVGNGCSPGSPSTSTCSPSQLYHNVGGTLVLTWTAPITRNTTSVAWGDVDGDGDLDLAVGNDCLWFICYPNQLYRNTDGVLMLSWTAPTIRATTSVAWGDVDGDGDLDLAIGNSGDPNQLYRNNGGTLTLDTAWNPESRTTQDMAWGDVDGDGDLDLLVGNAGQANQLYRNNGGTLTLDTAWNPEPRGTRSVAWGDVDGDGDLDLLVANQYAPNQLYLNGERGFSGLPNNAPALTLRQPYTLTAAGFYAMSGYLTSQYIPITYTLLDPGRDPVGGNKAIYSPDGGGKWYTATMAAGTLTQTLTPRGYWNAAYLAPTLTLSRTNSLTSSLMLTSTSPLTTTNVKVWVTISHTQASALQLVLQAPTGVTVTLVNTGTLSGALTQTLRFDDAAPTSILSATAPYSGTYRPMEVLTLLDGLTANGQWRLRVNNTATDTIGTLAAWGIQVQDNAGVYVYTWDTFTSGFFGQSDNVVFRLAAYPTPFSSNVDVTGTYRYVNSTPVFQHPYASATTFPFRVRGTQVRVLSGTQSISNAIVYDLPANQTFGATLFADSAGKPFHTDRQGYLQGRGRIGIGDRLAALYPVYSQYRDGSVTFDGENDYVSVLGSTTPISNSSYTLATLIKPTSMGSQGIVGWGNYSATNQINALRLTASGLANSWGSNDLAVATSPLTDTWHYVIATFDGVTRTLYLDGVAVGGDMPNGHAVPDSSNFQIGSTNGSEYFAGEIGEISIWNVARTPAEIQADMVRALKGNEPGLVGYWRFDEGSGGVAHDQTSNHNDGTLSGPTWNGGGEQYTVYHTSAAPNSTGLSMTTVVSPGVQVLTVTAANSLALFNLDVSLEWDARQDQQFLSQLDHDLLRTSEVLYDWSNGQAALGNVNVYFDRDHWWDADVQIYATNRLRPNAAQGGIVTDWLVDPITTTRVITYEAGQVSMGVVWNRYGETNGNLGEDWPRALAHELGHYALFLDDDYLGLDMNNRLIPIDTCTGTAMSDPYREDYSEFHAGGPSWTDQDKCGRTLAANETGRWDWATVTTFYPWLNGTITNTGPSGLPLEVTQIHFIEPPTSTTVLPAPIFNLTQDGGQVQPGTSARAFLYHDDQVTDLGNPTLDQIDARGARVGDRLCVYDLSAQRLGCETITAGDEELELISRPDWQPDILASPINSHTINLGVNLTGLPLALTVQARLYPLNDSASPTITLVRTATAAASVEVSLQPSAVYSYSVFLPVILKSPATIPGYAYAGTFTLDEPAPQGYIQVWIDEPDQRRESVVDYTLGGNPAYQHGHGAYQHGHGAYQHGHGAYQHGHGAPAQSADGQVLIFADGLVFDYGEFFALQAVSALTTPPAGASLVGQAYHLMRSAGAPSLVGASLSFYYAGRDVPPGEEDFLSVRFWDGAKWRKLPTVVDTEHNIAVATIPSTANGVGVYALMSNIEIPLYGPGWNQFGYPAQGSKSITQALASISDSYGIVYGTALTDTIDPWKVYAVNAPAWVNDLATLDFGKTYWISVTQAITLQVTGGGTSTPSSVENLPSPPMTVYGTAPISGDVTAWINGVQCGQGQTKVFNNQIVYTLNIQPDAPGGKVGCGAAGRIVAFKIGLQLMSTSVGWDIDRTRNIPLSQ